MIPSVDVHGYAITNFWEGESFWTLYSIATAGYTSGCGYEILCGWVNEFVIIAAEGQILGYTYQCMPPYLSFKLALAKKKLTK